MERSKVLSKDLVRSRETSKEFEGCGKNQRDLMRSIERSNEICIDLEKI